MFSYTHIIGGFHIHLVNCQGTFTDIHIVYKLHNKILFFWLFCELIISYTLCIMCTVGRGQEVTPMNIKFTLFSLEIKLDPKPKKKSPTPKKPQAQSNSLESTVIINQK